MDNNWGSLSPNKDDQYFELNDHTEESKPQFNENDQFILNQIENNLYVNNSNGINKLSDFSLDNFVIPEDMSFKDVNGELMHNLELQNGHEKSDEPKSETNGDAKSTAFPPSNNSVNNTPSMLPNSHLVDGQMRSSPILPSQNGKSFNNQHYYHSLSRSKSKELLEQLEHHPKSQHVRPDAVFTPLVSPHGTPLELKNKYPIQASFEPLTSPALNAQHPNYDKRRSSSSMFSTVDENRPSHFKRRTPHGTPVMQGFSDSKSPVNGPAFEKLPEASVTTSNSNSDSSTPMLPPQNGYKKIDPESTNTSPQMMGFTMGKLAKQQSIHHESPVLRSRKSSFNSNKSSDDSPNLSAQDKTKEKPTSKKASHKLAEQGRRNRMNTAVQSLGSLIPQNYHDRVSIPSKATTVELAATYIQDLRKELDRIKKK